MSLSAWLVDASARFRPVRVLTEPPVVPMSVVDNQADLSGKASLPAAASGSPGGVDARPSLDVEQEVRAALQEAAASATGRTRFEFAVRQDLATRTDAQRFRKALAAMIAHAAMQAPMGRVLVTATRHGGRIQVTVGDDGPGGDRAIQAAALREVESLIAMQGGTLEIIAQPGEGTRLVARWPDAPREPTPSTGAAGSETASRGQDAARTPRNEFSH